MRGWNHGVVVVRRWVGGIDTADRARPWIILHHCQDDQQSPQTWLRVTCYDDGDNMPALLGNYHLRLVGDENNELLY